LVEQRRSASSASCSYAAYEDIGLLLFSAVTEAKNIRTVGRDFWTAIQDLHRNGISSSEIQKVKSKLRLHQLMQTEDALNLAQVLSYYQAYGGYEKLEEYLIAMEELDEEQILKVAEKYLQISNLSVLEFVNEDAEELNASKYEQVLQDSFTAPEVTMP